jgi:hypothetical protein
MRVQDDAAADRVSRRIAADDEAIARHRDDRQLQADLHVGAVPGADLLFGVVDESDVAEELGREKVETDARLLLQWSRVGQKIEARGDDL